MGRYYFSKKQEADYLKKIEIRWLKKQGYLNGWKFGTITWTHGFSGSQSSIDIMVSILDRNGYIRFQYTQTDSNGEKKEFDYRNEFTTTSCNYGGVRYWFICGLWINGVYCGRRVGVLYKAGDYFGCRHCYDLTYSSKNENRRYKNYPLFYMLFGYKKADELRQQIKRPYYAGKPTRKQARLDNVYKKMLPYAILLKKDKGV